MKAPANVEVVLGLPNQPGRHGRTALLSGLLLLLSFAAWGNPLVTIESPLGFFTNVASRLLSSELNLDLDRIQVYPTNQYTPAVHRLLQVTVNIYDAATNQTGTISPRLPTVFRPLFRRDTNGIVYIAGYKQVTNTSLVQARTAPRLLELETNPNDLLAVPPLATPASSIDREEPLVSGIPLVIGARKGLPNFNEFAMQTYLYISRLLEFRRSPGQPNAPVVQTNQMYVLAISNSFALEAWNSYSNAYPHNLQILTAVDITAILTNELGQVLLSNRVSRGSIASVGSNSWPGWSNYSDVHSSFFLPWGSGESFFFLTNSTYINQKPWFEPQTHSFQPLTGFYIPFWWLLLNTRLRVALVDTDANRIVDYVNLNNWEKPLNIALKLTSGASSNLIDFRNAGNPWLTNRPGNSISTAVPTYGILNQLQIRHCAAFSRANSFS